MPIRFRCVYCNQLLGISRRKAGTIVRCTTCEGQLIVPDPSDVGTEAAGADEHAQEPQADPESKTAAVAGPGGVFEASEFDAFLEPLAGDGGPVVASPPAPPPTKRPAVSSVTPQQVAPHLTPAPIGDTAALALTSRGLTIAVVLLTLAIGLSFAGGLWLGMSLRQ